MADIGNMLFYSSLERPAGFANIESFVVNAFLAAYDIDNVGSLAIKGTTNGESSLRAGHPIVSI